MSKSALGGGIKRSDVLVCGGVPHEKNHSKAAETKMKSGMDLNVGE